MKIYTHEDLNNLQSGDKETVLKAEKTFITIGEGIAVKAIRFSDMMEVFFSAEADEKENESIEATVEEDDFEIEEKKTKKNKK